MAERIGRLTGMRWGDYGEEEEEIEIIFCEIGKDVRCISFSELNRLLI